MRNDPANIDMTRIVILALGHSSYPHEINELTQKRTWARGLPPNVKVFWVHDNLDSRQVIVGSDRKVSVPLSREELSAVPWGAPVEKTTRSIAWALGEFQPNFILRTNSSSYIDIARLVRELDQVPDRNLYSGCLGVFRPGQAGQAKFVSGAAALLSADVAAELAAGSGLEVPGLLEDVAIGEMLKLRGVNPTLGTRVDLSTGEPLSAHWHVRLKSYVDDRLTRQRMTEVDAIFREEDHAKRLHLMRVQDRRELLRRPAEQILELRAQPNRDHLKNAGLAIPGLARSLALRRRSVSRRCRSFDA